MPIYPDITYDLQYTCISLGPIPKSPVLQIGDILYINLNGNLLSHTFTPNQVLKFKIEPDSELIVNDCRITYDIENNTLYIFSLFRNNNIKFVYLQRTDTNKKTLGVISSTIPPKLRIPLKTAVPLQGDEILYYINGISYIYEMTDIGVLQLRTDEGWNLNKINHNLRLQRTYFGNYLFLTASKSTDVFTHFAQYNILNTLGVIKSNDIESAKPSNVIFNIYDEPRVGDTIKIVTTKNVYNIVLNYSTLFTLLSTSINVYSPFNIELIKYYKNGLIVYDIQFSLIPTDEEIISAEYVQLIAISTFNGGHILHKSITMTSNPFYDTSDELLLYSKPELDHRKQRCICTIAGILNRLKLLYGNTSVKAQSERDHIMDYQIYPNTCELSLKQYLYDNYGPFTSPRPNGSPYLVSSTPTINSIGITPYTKQIILNFDKIVNLGFGNIYLYPFIIPIVLKTIPINYEIGVTYKLQEIKIIFGNNIKKGIGKISLMKAESPILVYNGSTSIPNILKYLMFILPGIYNAGSGTISLIPIATSNKINNGNISVPLGGLLTFMFNTTINPGSGTITLIPI